MRQGDESFASGLGGNQFDSFETQFIGIKASIAIPLLYHGGREGQCVWSWQH
jgi:hypothetical protein